MPDDMLSLLRHFDARFLARLILLLRELRRCYAAAMLPP